MSDQQKDKSVQQLKDALLAIRKLKSDLREERLKNSEPLAIIGMSMRFPGGVRNATDYWELLSNGVDAITDIPTDRFSVEELYDAELSTSGKINVRQGGFIDGVDLFDSSFFDITPVEIESMDPQQRVLLELTHEALENAGLNVKEVVGSNTGVYVGIGSNDYQVRHFHSGDYNLVNPYSYTGSAGCAIAGRLSYMMGLQGPGMSIDTACSASIIAAHVGSSALRNRECDMAVIAGVNLMLSPEMTICFSNLQALSPDSRCKTFDNSANGYVRSEGSGVMILKRLNDARRDGDNVMAVIKGSASNQDGRSNGFTAPNVLAQTALIKKALADAGLKPEDIDYIEAHGTGTKIGDPIEVEALTNVFREHKTKEAPLIIGSVKSNIGHLESAAGMASMIKAVLSLQHQKIPQSIHVNQPNELVNWNDIPIAVATELTDFDGSDRNIGISGFGITGTNGHIIIGEAPDVDHDQESNDENLSSSQNDVLLLPLSARSPGSLAELAGLYAEFISTAKHEVSDICVFTALKRAQFNIRKLFVAESREDLINQLKEFSQAGSTAGQKFDEDDSVKKVFVFSGQGAQWPKMGMALANQSEIFKKALEECNVALSKFVDWDVFEELNKPEDSSRIKEGDVMQPLLMAVGIALAKWWMSMGIQPDAVVGHSMGEIAAAYIGGHITLDEAAQIITSRSRLMEEQAGKGMMLATDLNKSEAEQRIEKYNTRLSVSVMNSPSTTVIGGESDAIVELLNELETEGRWCRKVRMTVAAHTAQMDDVLDPLRTALNDLQPKAGPVSFYSSSQNKMMKGDELGADYWVKNVRSSVQFGAAIQELASNDKTVFIEIGPHAVLTAAIEENIQFVDKTFSAAVVSSFYREKNEVVDLYNNLGSIYRLGIDLDWTKTHEVSSEFMILPNYPWQRERYWFDEEPAFRSASAMTPATSDQHADSFFGYEWIPSNIQSDSEIKKKILILNSEKSDVEALLSNLQNNGHEVSSTVIGQMDLEESSFDIVVLAISPTSETSAQELDLEQETSACLNLQSVIKSASEAKRSNKLSIIILTQNVFPVVGNHVSASGAMLWGMARTMRNEYPELGGKIIDVSSLDDDVVARIITSGDSKEYLISNGAILEPRLNPSGGSVNEAVDLVEESCFLITGGTSGLGLAFAEWLAKNGTGRIALVSRSGDKPETKDAIKRMNEDGAKVKVFKADVSDLTSTKELVASIEVSLGLITGVVHAAGLVDDGTISNLTEEQFLTVARPKVQGTLNLHEILKDHDLAHFITFSSAATILGTVGQANYNAANFYMDQLMFARKQLGLAATSVNWGNIGNVGMAAAQQNRGERFKSMGFYPIMPEEFDHHFKTVFQAAEHQIAAMKIDFDLWATAQPSILDDSTFVNVLKKAGKATTNNGLDWGSSLAMASKKIRDLIKTNLTGITKIPNDKLKEDETFKSMGIDSMMALQLRNKIQEVTALSLPVTSIWAHPTIEKYASFLLAELQLEQQLNGSADERKTFSSHQLKEMVKESISSITKLPANRIKETDTFKSMGIDSMQALQIKNNLQGQTGITLAASSIWAHPTVEKYAAFLTSELGTSQPKPDTEAQETKSSSISDEVEDLSLDELMKQLDDKSKEY